MKLEMGMVQREICRQRNAASSASLVCKDRKPFKPCMACRFFSKKIIKVVDAVNAEEAKKGSKGND